MPSYISRRWAILRAKFTAEGGDVVVGDFVRPVWGGQLMFVEVICKDEKRNSWATCLKIANPHGYREILETRYLKVASADPAFGPDVREP